MISVSTNDILNRLLVLHHRSLPNYLKDAAPWTRPGNEHASEVLLQIAADQRVTVDRLGEFILETGEVDTGEYPMVFTAYNDLSFDFLLDRLIAYQQRDIGIIQQCVTQLGPAPLAKAVVEEALGAALAHLDSLRELKPGNLVAVGHGTV